MLEAGDLGILITLIFLEAVLSVDNAVVLATVAATLPTHQQSKALHYGMLGAIAFRVIAVMLAQSLLQLTWIKYLGGAYLIFTGAQYFFRAKRRKAPPLPKRQGLWWAIFKIETLDIIFSLDSILAAIGLSKKIGLVTAAGIFGIVMIRFLSTFFISALKARPTLESSAFAIVALVGLKVILEAMNHLTPNIHLQFDSFQRPEFWIFWGLLLSSFLFGFLRQPVPEADL